MSEYQVIARKWRPQSFADVVGQEHVVRTLRNAVSSGRIAHAYLLVGPRGIGKTTLARIFAKALNCEQPVNGEPCCKCPSCLELAAERSLDVMEIDAASRNSTMDMRELAENALTRPVNGKFKIYIIDEVHMLSKAAWNVLLKTVEEPPAHVKFIFATTEVHQVLPTIISRCQRFDLMPIPTRLIAERLQLIADTEKVSINPAAVNAIARAAEGGMRDAQSLLDQMIAFFAAGDGSQITEEQVLSLFGLTDRADLYAVLQAMLLNEPGKVVSRIANLAKRGKNLETLFDDLLHALRAVQLCTIMADPSDLLDESPESMVTYRKLAQSAPRDTIQILLENVAPVGRVLHDALNKQVYLETVLLKAMREAHAVRIGDILARLNQLRSAGELKFIDSLPPVEKNIPVVLPEKTAADREMVAVPVEVKPVEPPVVACETQEVKPVEPPVVACEKQEAGISVVPVVEKEPEIDSAANVSSQVVYVEEEESEIQTANTGDESAPVCEPENGVESEANDDVISEDIAAVESVPIVEKAADNVVESVFELDANPENDAEVDENGDIVPEYNMDAEKYSYRSYKEDKSAESYTPDRLQKSIANDHPQALTDVLQYDPVVKEAVDLFNGSVLDIHR